MYSQQEFEERYGAESGIVLYKKIRNKKANTKKPFSLNWEDIDLLARPLLGFGLCDYTNVPFGEDEFSPSLERMDAEQGYIRGNVCVVTKLANETKNIIVDQKEREKGTVTAQHKDTICKMMSYCSLEHMESLKNKYNPDKNSGSATLTNEDTMKEVTENKEETKTVVELPEDVKISKLYFAFIQDMVKHGYTEISLTYFEFKAALKAKRCFITGKELTIDNCSPVILDFDQGIHKSNLKFAEEKAAVAINNLMLKTDMTLSGLVSNLKRISK